MPVAHGRPGERLQADAGGLRSQTGERLGSLWWWFFVRGALALCLGVAVFIRPSETLSALVRLVGFYCLLDGTANLAAVVRGAHLRTAWLGALAGIGAGGVLLLWPDISLRVLLLAFGGWAMLIGSSHALLARSRGEGTSTMTLGWLLAGVGLALVLWRGADVVVIAWIIAVAALVIAAALLYVASRLRFLQAASGGT